jgi:uncharacterized protein
MSTSVKHDKKYQQFTIEFEEDDAELAYALPEDGVIDFTHTFVPKSKRDNGYAEDLITTGLDYARQNKLNVIATCPAVAKFIKTHKEYQDLLKK